MLRFLLSLLLAGATVAATAQTAPRTVARPPAAPRKTAATPAPVASDTATATGGRFGTSTGSSANDGGQGQGVYAAPGMAVDIKKGKEVEPYNSTNAGKHKPARKASTLSSPK